MPVRMEIALSSWGSRSESQSSGVSRTSTSGCSPMFSMVVPSSRYTPGYVIWTFPLKLVDGTNARMPMTGVYRLDGSTMENIGEQPDVLVRLSPEDWLSDRDPQLDKAISILTGQESAKP